jgi:hypothetical protein
MQSAVRGSPEEVSNFRSSEEPTGTIAELFAPRHSQVLPPAAIDCTVAGYRLELPVRELFGFAVLQRQVSGLISRLSRPLSAPA